MKKIKHYAKEILSYIVIITILTNVISLYKSQDLTQRPLDMTSAKLINNQVYNIPVDKPVLIHFWATWCPVCKFEASNINFLSKYFTVLTIAVKSGDDQKIQKYLDEHHYKYKVINDSNGVISSKFKISGFPTTFIYDKNKKLTFSEVGYTSTLGLLLRLWWVNLSA